jgi:hypothetical protein
MASIQEIILRVGDDDSSYDASYFVPQDMTSVQRLYLKWETATAGFGGDLTDATWRAAEQVRSKGQPKLEWRTVRLGIRRA